MRDERLGIADERIRRVGVWIMWRGALAVAAHVGHDQPPPRGHAARAAAPLRIQVSSAAEM